MTGGKLRVAVLATAAFALIVAACGSSSKSSSNNNNSTTTAASSNGPWGWPGNATTGYLAPHQPDVNKDGKVVIGVISPGDTHDKGYYESFVDQANKFAADNGWKVITVDKVPDSQAAQAARNMCQQHPDMVAIAASELKDAIPVASEPVCKNTVWYVAGGQGVNQTPYFVQTNDIESQSSYVSGVAAGMLMKDKGAKKAGFITGPQASFTTDFAKGWEAGIKSQVPDATVVTTYTGSFDDSGKAVEAYNAQKAQGIGIVYPYLGGATFAVAGAAQKDNIPVLTPGTDNCAIPSPKFAVSVIFDPGTYFATALRPFKAGNLYVGKALTFHMGKDPAPTVIICNPTPAQKSTLDKLIADVGSGKVRTDQLTGLNDYNGYDPTAATTTSKP
jgi:basic membrane protein A and related proteins